MTNDQKEATAPHGCVGCPGNKDGWCARWRMSGLHGCSVETDKDGNTYIVLRCDAILHDPKPVRKVVGG
jgi:hypothetical protein